ncbi:MAG: hypothetical protein GQ565_11715 [Candidatus Aegiribacteria sp.]|nr:hypothetical protein [Candidatus Aegiribacteria sp.]
MKYLCMGLIIALCVNCAEQPPTDDIAFRGAEEESILTVGADVYLTVTDSIGAEFGDSNYVFGEIVDADIMPNGNIVVLDRQKAQITVFSPSGTFIGIVCRKGNGPGELQLPSSLGMASFPLIERECVIDSIEPGLVVCDVINHKLIYFNSNLEHMIDVNDFFPSPPVRLSGVEGGTIIGMQPQYQNSEERSLMGFIVAKWEIGEQDPSTVYFERMSPYHPNDLSTMHSNTIVFGTTPEGTVFTAPLSSEVYEITAWNSEGEEIFTIIDASFEMVSKTQDEIDFETEIVRNRMPESMATWEPNPYRSAIEGIWYDDQNRIWVNRGTIQTKYFDIYNMDGNHLFTASIDAGDRSKSWHVQIQGNRFIAFDVNPELYPQIFIGELPSSVE